MLNETEVQDAQTLVENWEVMRPIIQEVQRKTGLSRVEYLLVWIATMDGEEPLEPWQAWRK